jgi:uncharacterized membrane protein YedE/YeeE
MATHAQHAPAATEDLEADEALSGTAAPSALWFLLLGTLFGIVLVKAEVVSWFRIQEMFRFQSFQMYGIIGTAVGTAALSIALLKRFGLHTVNGAPIEIPPKELGRGFRYIIGGALFGIGWALTGACPGPLFALTASGSTVYLAAIASALVGTWVYGYLRPRLPHY